MGKRKGPTPRRRDNRDDPASATWVISDVGPDGRYIPAIQCGEDRVFSPKDPVAYAVAVIRACGYARYDAAVLAQMTQVVKGDESLAAAVVKTLREDRPPIDDAATYPLTFEPIVSARDRSPQLLVRYNGEDYTQWTPKEAEGHAMHVLDVHATVDLDAAYYRELTASIGAPSHSARAAVGDLANYRSDS